MWQGLFPNERCQSAYTIDYELWYARGKRAVLFDIDNTLVRHGAPADPEAVALFARLHEIGFRTCLISNNEKERVEPFAKAVGTQAIWKAGKPSAKNFLKACELMGVTPKETLFVGDQIFTDTAGARQARITALLVKPIHPKEEFHITLKRIPEFFVLQAYEFTRRKRGNG